jgi:hypothetical protein
LSVDIELRRIEYRLQPITKWPPTAPITLHRLTGGAAVHALPQVVEEDFVHQSFETPMHLAGLARGIVAIARGDNPQTAEFEAADGALTLHRVTGQSRQIVNN